MRLATVLLTIGLSLSLSGCWFGKKAAALPPPPAAAAKAGSSAAAARAEAAGAEAAARCPRSLKSKSLRQITLPAPQKIATPAARAEEEETPPTPPPPPPPVEQPPVQPPPPPPQLGEILSDGRAPPVRSRLRTESLARTVGTAASVGQIAQSNAEGNRGTDQDIHPASGRIQGERPGYGAATGAQGRRARAGPAEGLTVK